MREIRFLVAMRAGETPVHIPNTMVKTEAADNTILVTVWQNRWLPDLNKIIPYNVRNCMKYNFNAGGCVLQLRFTRSVKAC